MRIRMRVREIGSGEEFDIFRRSTTGNVVNIGIGVVPLREVDFWLRQHGYALVEIERVE